jgi:hypothetical protein
MRALTISLASFEKWYNVRIQMAVETTATESQPALRSPAETLRASCRTAKHQLLHLGRPQDRTASPSQVQEFLVRAGSMALTPTVSVGVNSIRQLSNSFPIN